MASMTETKTLLFSFFETNANWIILLLICLCILMIGIIIRKFYLLLITIHLKKRLLQKIINVYENEDN
jgi:hypothetical protein